MSCVPLLVLVIGKTDTHIYRNLQYIVVYKWLIFFWFAPDFPFFMVGRECRSRPFLVSWTAFELSFFYLTYHVYMYNGPMNVRIMLMENKVS